MTEYIIAFPITEFFSLNCVWFETGKPRPPLECKWILHQQLVHYRVSIAAVQPRHQELCA